MTHIFDKKILVSPFCHGMKAGVPIGAGYFAVSFSLGIMASVAGLNPFQGFLASFLCHASAGEYAGFTVITALGSYLEIAVITLIANARYMLMSTAYSQRIDPDMPFVHRLGMAYFITDEIFAVSIANPGYLNPYYSYGATFISSPCWCIGTALGVYAGDVLPARIVTALSVSLFGMFLAIVIPQSKKDKIVLVFVIASFILSYIFSRYTFISSLSDGTRTIILTVIISAVAAYFFPRKE